MPCARRRRRLCGFLPFLALLPGSLASPSDANLARRAKKSKEEVTIAAPLSINPAQNWEGIDGTWNTFTVQVGTPAQTVRLQISTASQQTWVVGSTGCDGYQISDCSDSRGGFFYTNESSSWEPNGRFELWIESNLGYDGTADYGFDVLTLGGLGDDGPTVKNTTVGAMRGDSDFWYGHFGVNPKSTNWSSYADPTESYMTLLKEQKLIPSVSFGYTAGAEYRFTKVLSSLTLGGYDSSRFIENNVTFIFAPDNERDLVVAIQSIESSSGSDSNAETSLLPDPIYAYIDSTVPQIWLPLAACQAFEKAFGLSYDNDTDLYIVNDTLHEQLLKSNPNVTFTLAQSFTGGPNVAITLPYAAFDMQASPPYQNLVQQVNYFPLRRAVNETQYTLGRTFLQEAYLTVDWEAERFNVSQCSWVADAQSTIVAIPSANDTLAAEAASANSGLSGGAIAGIVIGVLAGVAIIALAVWFFFVRRRLANRRLGEKLDDADAPPTAPPTARPEDNVIPKIELDATQIPGGGADPDVKAWLTRTTTATTTLSADGTSAAEEGTGTNTATLGTVSEADGTSREIYEMPGDETHGAQEAGGRQLSEKESMLLREERYNGVDPSTSAPATTRGSSLRSAGQPTSPTSPTSPVSPATTRSHSGTGLSIRGFHLPLSAQSQGAQQQGQRRHVRPGDVIELSPFERDNVANSLVSPVSPTSGSGSGSDGHPTLGPTSSLRGGPAVSVIIPESPESERARRRFSYE